MSFEDKINQAEDLKGNVEGAIDTVKNLFKKD